MDLPTLSQWLLKHFPECSIKTEHARIPSPQNRMEQLISTGLGASPFPFALLCDSGQPGGLSLSFGPGPEAISALLTQFSGSAAPHPRYGKYEWIEVTDPSEKTLAGLLPFLEKAHAFPAAQIDEPAFDENSKHFAEATFLGRVHEPRENIDVFHLPVLLPPADVRLIEVLQGLPHPCWHSTHFDVELWLSDNIGFHSYRFYRKPMVADRRFSATLLKVLGNPDTYHAYTGMKRCGGYHADFAVHLESTSGTLWVLICLGCDEAILYGESSSLHCNLDHQAATVLRNHWDEYLG